MKSRADGDRRLLTGLAIGGLAGLFLGALVVPRALRYLARPLLPLLPWRRRPVRFEHLVQ